MKNVFIIHLSLEGYLDCCHSLAVVNRAAVNTNEQISVEKNVKSFGHVLSSGINGP